MKRCFPQYNVVSSPRASKVTDLISGKVDAIQVYTTTEIPTLRRMLQDLNPGSAAGDSLVTIPLNWNGKIHLGYSQVLFASNESLQDEERRKVVESFLKATFEGCGFAIRNPEKAVEMVHEARKMVGTVDDESNDHWYPSKDFELEMTRKCNDLVKSTFQCDRYGVIDPVRWNRATQWLADGAANIKEDFGLEKKLWTPPNNLLGGNHLALRLIEDARASAIQFEEAHGRKPSLAVVTVGELERYSDSERRREIYGSNACSWFTKMETGQANNVDVKEINLPHETTTNELLSLLSSLTTGPQEVDGIQLMRPFPSHINTAKVLSAVPLEKDVDGINYICQQEIGNMDAYKPVTPAAVMALLNEYDINVSNKSAVVIGRGPFVGSPIAYMLREAGAAVTTIHSGVDSVKVEKFTREVDIVVCCAGSPGVIKAEWVKSDAIVINVGTTFSKEDDKLLSDVEGDLGQFASKYSPVPGGIGPLSSPILFQNVVDAAWNQIQTMP